MRVRAAALLGVVAALLVVPAMASAAGTISNLPRSLWRTNGSVESSAVSHDGSRLYVVGDFDYVGKTTGSSVRLGTNDARQAMWPTFSAVGGSANVAAIVDAPGGGWFVAGAFDSASGLTGTGYTNLVKVGPGGYVDQSWNRSLAVGPIVAAAVDGTTLVVASANGSIDAFNTSSGTALWHKEVSGGVPGPSIFDIDAAGGYLYVAGSFGQYAGNTAANLAKASIADGTFVTAFTAAGITSGAVRSIDLKDDGSKLALIGSFSTTGGTGSPGLAILNASTGSNVSPAFPSPQSPGIGSVVEFDPTGRLYAANSGGFLGSGTCTVIRFTTGGTIDGTWCATPPVTADATTLDVTGTDVLVGLSVLTQRGGANVWSIDSTNSAVMSRRASVGGAVLAIQRAGTDLVVGGDFMEFGGAARPRIAAIDLVSGGLDPWKPTGPAPGPGDHTRAVVDADFGDVVIVGGSGTGGPQLWSWDAYTGAPGGVAAGAPPGGTASASVNALHVAGSYVYVGGTFTSPNPGLYRMAPDGTRDNLYTPTVPPDVTDIDHDANFTYVAGSNGSTPFLKRLVASGTPDGSWLPTLGSGTRVRHITVNPSGTDLWAVGDFSAQPGIARIPLASGGQPQQLPLFTATAAQVTDLLALDTTLVASLTTAQHAIEVDPVTGASIGWNPGWTAVGGALTIAGGAGNVFVGAAHGVVGFRQTTDMTLPELDVVGITDDAPGSSDATYVAGASEVFVRTNGPVAHPGFTARVRAYDPYDWTQPDASASSGLQSVGWGSVPAAAGTWTPGDGMDAAAPRGLTLTCYRTGSGFNTSNPLGPVVDPQIAYKSAQPPYIDQWLTRPGQLIRTVQPTYDDAGTFATMGCRWDGYLLAPRNAGSTAFTVEADNGFRLQLGANGANQIPGTWNAFDGWGTGMTVGSPVGPIAYPVPAASVLPMRAEFWENSGDAAADLQWNAISGTASIPPVAYATDVFYEREYRYQSGAATNGAVSVQVTATDEAGRTKAGQVTVKVDNAPPVIGAFGTNPSPTSVGASLTPTINASAITDSPGAGLESVRIERRSTTLVGASCTPIADPNAGWSVLPAAVTLGASGSASYTEPTPLGDGCWQYRVVVTDNVGNQAVQLAGVSDTAWMVVDTTPPVNGSLAYTGGWTSAMSTTLNAVLPVDLESGIGTVKLERLTAPISAGACGIWDATWTVRPWSPAATTTESLSDVDGKCVQYQVTATNGVGTPVSWGPGTVLKVDRSMPSLSSFSYPNPARGTITFSGTFSDVGGVVGSSVAASLGLPPGSSPSCVLMSASDWTCTWDTTTVVDGSYSGSMQVTDPAGNTGARSFFPPIVVDNTKPALLPVLMSGGADSWQSAVGAPIFVNTNAAGSAWIDTGATDTGSGLGSWSVTAVAPWAWTTGPGVTGTLAWDAGAPQPTIPVDATDMAGNTQLQTLDVRVDTAAPTGFGAAYTGGVQQGSAPSIDLATGGDGSGAGVASAVLQRQANQNGDCSGSWIGSFSTIAGWTTPPITLPTPYVDATVASGSCYQYQLVVTDRVGNVATVPVAGTFRTDVKGVLIQVAGSATTIAEGGSVVAKVSLRAKPTGAVRLTVAGDAQLGVAPATLDFDATTWATPQDVTITSPQDQRDEPDTGGVVTWAIDQALTADTEYDAVSTLSTALTVIDDDVPAVVVTPPASGLAVAEPGSSLTYTVKLATQPWGNVEVRPAIASQAAVGTSSVTFTPTDWSSPKQVTVTALDDPDVDGPQVVTLTHAIVAGTAGDLGYANLAVPGMPVSVSDDDQAAMVVTAPAAPTVTEGDAASTVSVGVQLRARPSADVTVAVSSAQGQLAPNTSAVTFTPANWNAVQTVVVGAADDTLAEPATHGDTLRLVPSTGAGGAWAGLAPANVDMTVRDDDPAKLVKVAGPRWEVDADGHVLLDETATQGAVLRIHAIGDPRRDVKITADSAPDGQVDVQPASVTIPAGSHDQYVSFSVRAINDRVDEADTHSAKVTFAVTTSDPMYASATVPPATARITDAPAPTGTTREGSDPGAGGGNGGSDQGSGGGSYTPPPNDGQPQPTGGNPQPQGPAPGGDTGLQPGEVVGDRGVEDKTTVVTEETTSDDETRREKRQARRAKRRGAIKQGAQEVKQWAGENKGKAAVAATATTSAAIWAAKGFGLAGKAMASGGGGMPHPPGLGQLRHLFKRRNRERLNRLRRRWWRGKMRDLDDDDDWDDFLWGDHAA